MSERTETSTYLHYVEDEAHQKRYSEFRKRYAHRMRDCDRELLRLVRAVVSEPPLANRELSGLDVGCSTGLLLRHLRGAFPQMAWAGGDLSDSIIRECQSNPDLAGIEFSRMDVTTLPNDRRYDVVLASATLCVLNEEEFDRALGGIAGLLRPGGAFLALDYLHPFVQEITVTERISGFVNPFTFRFRSYDRVRSALEAVGLALAEFEPFRLSVDLPLPEDPADTTSHTKVLADGSRLCFHGVLHQPWCLLTARRPE